MDDRQFDNLTRTIARVTDRRTAVMGFAAGAAALLTLVRADLGLAQSAGLGLEQTCQDNGNRCKRDNQCCSLKCKLRRRRRGRGKCVCAGQGARCQRDIGCCFGVCRNGSCDCGERDDFCNENGDCCSRQCSQGKCLCARSGDRCDTNRACCSGTCGTNGFCT